MYSFAEADRLAGLSRGTARRWLQGYYYQRDGAGLVSQSPVTPPAQSTLSEGVSFLDLVELVAIRGLKARGFGLPSIRRIVTYCQARLGVAHPLASLAFKTDGRDIFVDHQGALLDVPRRQGARAWNEVLAPFLDTLDYEDALARRWWPLGKRGCVMVDPDYGFGLPVVAASGVRTEIIRERFLAGDTAAQVADDYNLEPAQVEAALRFELHLQHAA